MIGQVVGHFTVIAKLGEGGQGEVYLATDSKLERKVALKILPPQALENEALYHRFILEAKAAASLDHPNICTIYSIEEVGGQTLMAMAYLEGETIRQKIENGPLPLDKAVEFALQTLKGLDAAHKEGIVHRDIKSSNLMVVNQGLVKVLDFGLATAADRTRITATNTVLGTPSYMSPEQVRGETVDRRSDLWSVGVVLHEMVTGALPFRGESAHVVLNAILTQEPEPLTGLRTGVPIELDRIVRKALGKDPDERYQHADDLSADLRSLHKGISGTSVTGPTRRLSQPAESKPRCFGWIPWGIAAIATLVLIIVMIVTRMEPQTPDVPVLRLSINLPDEAPLNIGMIDGGSMVISPDGRNLVYVGKSDNETRLFRRSLEGTEVTAIPETLGARSPFFSPDSQRLGFFADNELFKSTLDGSSLRVAPVFGRRHGACWASDGSIYLGLATRFLKGPLEALSLDGEAVPLTELISGPSQIYEQHSFPEVLPDGRGLLYISGRREGGSAVLYQFESREQTVLIEDAVGVGFLPPGFLVFSRIPDQLFAVEFDLDSLQTVGEPVRILDGIWLGFGGRETWTVSDTGTLVYVAGNRDQYRNRLVWVDHNGHTEAIVDVGISFLSPRVSPNGRYLLVQHEGAKLRVFDLETKTWARLTGGAGSEWWAAWHPDGETVIFNSDRNSRGTVNLYAVNVEGGTPERLTRSDRHHEPQWISMDGKYLIYLEAPVPETGFDIWALRLDIEEPPRPLLTTPANTVQPALSPDSRWLAYASDESGREEVYVQAFPEMSRQSRVSTQGGVEPIWSHDGKVLYFRSPDGREAFRTSFEAGPEPEIGDPEHLFSGDFQEHILYGRTWDLHPDGQRFLLFEKANPVSRHELKVVVNWTREIEEKLARQ